MAGEESVAEVDTKLVWHWFHGMKNITITVDEEVARWARIWAAKHNTSVSRLLGEVLAERMRRESHYEDAMKRFLRKRPPHLREPGLALPSRDTLHER